MIHMALPQNLQEFPDSAALVELAAKATGLDDFELIAFLVVEAAPSSVSSPISA